MVVENSVFEGNRASGEGGAIYQDADWENWEGEGEPTADVLIKNSTFINNTSDYEGRMTGTVTVDGKEYKVDYTTPIDEYDDYRAGGAITTRGNAVVEDSTFTGNHAGSEGGAISGWGDSLTVKNSKFNNNTAKWHKLGTGVDYDSRQIVNFDEWKGEGGAIDSYTNEFQVHNSEFENNSSGNEGGGAINADTFSTTISDSIFKSNSTEGNGGAIQNWSNKAEINDSLFSSNTAKNGGAVDISADDRYYDEESDATQTPTTTITNSKFVGNSATEKGGAINYSKRFESESDDTEQTESLNMVAGASTFSESVAEDENGTTSDEDSSTTWDFEVHDSVFENNTSGKGGGGAINSEEFNNTINGSTFKANSTEGNGGAIQIQGVTGIEDSLFSSNTANNNGGAIYLKDNFVTGIENSLFNSNTANNNGGAIYINDNWLTIIEDSLFNSNTANKGGAIYSKGNVNIVDSSFTNNSAKIGGAIYKEKGKMLIYEQDTAHINITSLNKDVVFSGNTAEKGGDIYLDNSTLNLNANTGHKISFNGGISGVNSVININDSTNNNELEGLTSTGTVLVDNYISPDTTTNQNSTLTVNVKGGTLAPTKEEYLDGIDLTLAGTSTLDLMNGQLGETVLSSFTSDGGNLKLDIDFTNPDQDFDFINIADGGTSNGTVNLTDVSLLSDLNDVNEINISLTEDYNYSSTIKVETPESGINSVTNDRVYTIKADGDNISIKKLTDSNGNALDIDGFTLAVNQNGTIGGLPVQLSDNRVFTANKDILITGNAIDGGWTGELGGKSLTVMGQGYTLNGNNNTGINVSTDKTLTFNDMNITGFKTSDNRKGALTVNDGTLNITASQKDITLGGTQSDTETNKNIVYLDGTKSQVNITADRGKSITIQDAMRSSNISNTINFIGSGNININDSIDVVTLVNKNENTIHNNYLNGVVYNLQSGNVHFTQDKYLNGLTAQNTLNFNGGTLDLANNSIGSIDLAALNMNANSNIMVDVDLANSTMDKLTAKEYNTNNYFLNVTKMNLLSDSKNSITKILFADNNLKNNVTTSVSEVAYSPIWKYGVGYDSETGEFTFTRGKDNSASSAESYNPSVLAAPVAAQMGGYFGMLDTYTNAFNNMDVNMLKPAHVRYAEQNANKYALSDTQNLAYESNDLSSGGMWFRPYTSYDSVRLKHGPKVHNTSYGSFVGGDTGFINFGNGFRGVVSPYISYMGSHQSYSGTNIYQNGGTLGVTGILYKGNFFTGLTIGAGLNGAEANTMYGHDTFGMLMAGIASKTGYNIEFNDGKFIIQPSLQLSYTFVDTFNFTNKAGVKIDSDPLHAVQINPNIRFVANTKRGWQPYLTVGMNWNIMDSDVMANSTALPDMYVKPYVQYGVGVQKTIKDRFTGFLQLVFRNGGKNGLAATFGGRVMLGKETKKL